GLAPIDRPRLAIVVLVDEPSGSDYFGSKVAGPAFAAIASESLRYLGVPGEPVECPPRPPGPQPDPRAARTCLPPRPPAAGAAAAAAPAPVPASPQLEAAPPPEIDPAPPDAD